jgi:hypothetical protein
VAEPSKVQQFADRAMPGRDPKMVELEDYAASRAERGELPSPQAANAMKGWEGMQTRQRELQAAMLDSIDPALGAEARGYLRAGWFGDAPAASSAHRGEVRDIDQLAAEESAKRPDAPPEEKAAHIFDWKGAFKTAGLGAAKNLASAVIPGGAAITAADSVVPAAKKALRDNATETKAKIDEKNSLPPAAPQAPQGGTLNAGLVVPQGGGGGAQVLTPGVVPLRGSSSQTQQTIEPEEARAQRQLGFEEELNAAEIQSAAEQRANQELMNVANERVAQNERFARMEADRRREEERIRANAEQRIAAAEKAFEEAAPDPNWNPYKEIAEGDDWGKKVMLGIGSMLGALGAVGTGGPDRFLEQMNASIQRKLELGRQKREHLKETVKGRKDAYSRALEALGSKRAMDAMEEARMWRGLDARVEQVAQQMGIDSQDARLLQIRSGIRYKQRELMMESAKQVASASQVQEAFQPIVAVGGGGGKDPTAEGLKEVMEAREKKGLPQLEAALNNMNSAIQGFSQDPSMMDQAAIWLSTGKAGPAAQVLSQWFSKNPAALSTFLNGYSEYRKSISGQALTEAEIAAIRAQVGNGDLSALTNFYQNVLARRDSMEQDIAAAFPGYYQIFHHNRQIGQNTPGPQSQFQPTRPAAGGSR